MCNGNGCTVAVATQHDCAQTCDEKEANGGSRQCTLLILATPADIAALAALAEDDIMMLLLLRVLESFR